MNYNYELVKPLLYKSRNKNPLPAADDMLAKNIFALPPNGKIHIDIDNNFQIKKHSRSIWRLIHGHTFLGDLFDSYQLTSNKDYIKYAERLLFKWFDYVERNPEDEMIYHDETTALRLMYWLNFNYFCREVVSTELILKLDEEIEYTVNLLCDNNFHSTNTNHGMFQDIALLAYSIMYFRNPTESTTYQLSLARLKDYFYSTFTDDGVHKEHSPDYHYMVTVNIKKITDIIISLHDSELSSDEEKMISIYKNAEKYAMHILQPNLYLPKISDCNNFLLTKRPTYYNLFPSENFAYVRTLGKEGEKPNQKQVLFKDAGYFISRSSWNKEATYLLFLASYNARYHKHSDDLSFILYDDGDLFVDSGPNGYDYESSLTKYAYSGFAHSTLIVNDTSLPRNDGFFNKVGISDAKFDEDGNKFEVTGYNERYSNVKHIRTINGDHQTKSYCINDTIESISRNEYKILYQLSSQVEPRINGNVISIFKKFTREKKAEITLEFDPTVKHYEIEILYGKQVKHQSFEFPKMGTNIESPTIVVKFYNEKNTTKVHSKIELKEFKIKETIIEEEEIYGRSNVKYNFYKSNNQSRDLLVVFSAMMPKYEYKYNYYNTLKNIDINQLYIKDDIGEFGNYFIGTNKKLNFEADVMSLIMNTMAKYFIDFDRITLVGSSKGAFASLYFGMKYGFKNVISGAPQTQIGNFVIDEAPHKDVADQVSGGTGLGDKLFLNSLLFNFKPIERDYSKYFICVGTEDHHFKGHLQPYYNYLKNHRISMNLEEIPGANHADLKLIFKDYLYQSLNQIYGFNLPYNEDYKDIKKELSISGYSITRIEDNQVKLTLDIPFDNFDIVYYLLNNKSEVIFKSRPQKNKVLMFDKSNILNTRIKIFLRSDKDVKKYITSVIRDIEVISLDKTI